MFLGHFKLNVSNYFQELSEVGYQTYCIPALGFKFINQDSLWDIMKDSSSYGGVVLTSQRAVESLQKVVALHKGTHLTVKALL